jgi:hypothetical protein
MVPQLYNVRNGKKSVVAFSSLVASEDRAPTVSADRIQKIGFADLVPSDEMIENEKHVIFDISEWSRRHLIEEANVGPSITWFIYLAAWVF